jgi:uncharacterized protein
MLAVRGRRQIGKSRLIEELIAHSDAKAIFYTASRQSEAAELRNFSAQIATSGTSAAAVATAGSIGSWEAALTLAASSASGTDPLVIVIDELPFLIESAPAIEAIIQKLWDRILESQPVLLVLIGSDISMMRALNDYGRPLYGRLIEMRIGPLSPAAVADLIGLEGKEALDAYLIIGGFPRLAQIWRSAEDIWSFLARELDNPESPLIVLGERSLAAEFPVELKARDVLEAIGAGERSFSAIMQRAQVSNKTLETALSSLIAKGVIEKAIPYSAQHHPKLSRYHVSDSYLRFWLRFMRSSISAVERGRGDIVLQQIRESWSPYSGQAIEPLVRDAVQSLLPSKHFGSADFVGSYWNRDGSVEIDLVGGREATGSAQIDFIGSIKWRETAALDAADAQRLIVHREMLPGADARTLLVGVSRTGFTTDRLDVAITAEEIVEAGRHQPRDGGPKTEPS